MLGVVGDDLCIVVINFVIEGNDGVFICIVFFGNKFRVCQELVFFFCFYFFFQLVIGNGFVIGEGDVFDFDFFVLINVENQVNGIYMSCVIVFFYYNVGIQKIFVDKKVVDVF